MWFLKNEWGLLDIPAMISNALRGLYASICELIYPGIAMFYKIFQDLGTLMYAEEFTTIYDKISLIIGIFMVFRVVFWLIESLVNPDTMSDKEKNPAKIIQKVLIALLLLAVTPTIFKYSFEIQNKIVKSNIIENIVSINGVPPKVEAGRYLAAELFVNFYTVNSGEKNGKITLPSHGCAEDYAGKGGFIYDNMVENGTMNNLNNTCLSRTEDIDDSNLTVEEYIINFNGLLAVAVGVFVFWIILMYCISLGTRYIQLIYLQIIAPIPIMCYLAPSKDNMFSKWLKQCTTTYLDLFIRIIVINFAMVLCLIILGDEIAIIDKTIGATTGWVKVFLIIGVLTFAKKAPDLIQELLPKSLTKASGDFGLSLKKRSESMLGGKFAYSTLKRAPGYVAGGLAGAAIGGVMGAMGGKGFGSRTAGFLSGASRGFGTGSKKGSFIKNMGEVRKNQAARNSKLEQWRIASGKGENEANTFGDWMTRKETAFKKNMGFETKAQVNERNISQAESFVKSFKEGNNMATSKILSQRGKTPLLVTLKGETRDVAKLIAEKEQATQTYNNFEQNKEQVYNNQKQIMLTRKRKELEAFNPEIDIANMSDEQKEQKLMEFYIKNGEADHSKAKTLAHKVLNSKDPLVKESVEQTLKEQLSDERESKINEQLNAYAHTQLNADVETSFNDEKAKAYEAMVNAEKVYSDYEDIGNFAFMVEQLTDPNAKYHAHYQNIIDEYNDLAESSADNELELGLEKITLEDLIEAKNDPKKLEELSSRYHKVKGVSDKITTYKRNSDYKKDSANDKFNG